MIRTFLNFSYSQLIKGLYCVIASKIKFKNLPNFTHKNYAISNFVFDFFSSGRNIHGASHLESFICDFAILITTYNEQNVNVRSQQRS